LLFVSIAGVPDFSTLCVTHFVSFSSRVLLLYFFSYFPQNV